MRYSDVLICITVVCRSEPSSLAESPTRSRDTMRTTSEVEGGDEDAASQGVTPGDGEQAAEA